MDNFRALESLSARLTLLILFHKGLFITMLSVLRRQARAIVIYAMLAIFAMQGMVAAAGSKIAQPLPTLEANLCVIDDCPEGSIDSSQVQDVSPTIEQLSDYVASSVPGSRTGFQFAMPVPPPVFFVSPDLPLQTPPPKD